MDKSIIDKGTYQHRQQLVWIAVSIVCCKTDRSCLPAKGIASFVNRLSGMNAVHTVLLEYGLWRNEHIRLSLLTGEAQADDLVQQASDHFNDFLKLPDAPYSAGHLHIDRYAPFMISNTTVLNKYNLPAGLSRILLEVLQEESADEETLITFAFYLHIALIKTVRQRGNDKMFGELLVFYNRAAADIPLQTVAGFEETETQLAGIAIDIMQDRDLPPWLATWVQLCNDEMEREAVHAKTLPGDQAHNRILYCIGRHPGITKEQHLFLCYSISKCLDSIL